MACARVWYALKQLPIEEYSIAELLDDPIGALLMKSDGVDRQALEYALHLVPICPPIASTMTGLPRVQSGSRDQIRPLFLGPEFAASLDL